MKVTLTIAGFDSSSGAGATADLMTFAAHGLYGTACMTALTVQSTRGVKRWEPVAGELVAETLQFLHEDLPPNGIKIGMLATGDVVRAVGEYLRVVRAASPIGERVPVVLDPVVRSSSGHPLLDEDGLRELEGLLGLVDWVTPNVMEVAALTGREVGSAEEVAEAAGVLAGRHPGLNVVVTGGHLAEPDDLVRTADGREVWLRGERVASRSTHGTGCAFSSALVSRLVLGDGPVEAVAAAKAYVTEAIRRAPEGIGSGNGPLDHLWPLRRV